MENVRHRVRGSDATSPNALTAATLGKPNYPSVRARRRRRRWPDGRFVRIPQRVGVWTLPQGPIWRILFVSTHLPRVVESSIPGGSIRWASKPDYFRDSKLPFVLKASVSAGQGGIGRANWRTRSEGDLTEVPVVDAPESVARCMLASIGACSPIGHCFRYLSPLLTLFR